MDVETYSHSIANRKRIQSYNEAKFIDITGQKFGKLLVISRSNSLWNCICDCGNKISVASGSSLRKGHTRSCGCLKIVAEDLTGQRFGKLLVISRTKIKGKDVKWDCVCDCGNKTIAHSGGLKNGSRKSCGCLIKYSDETLSSKHALYYKYQYSAKKRDIFFNLSFEQVMFLMQQNCYYCGKKPSQYKDHPDARKGLFYNGIDRINSKGSYEISNVVTCCKECNYLKWNRNKNEFIDWLKECYSGPKFLVTHNKMTLPDKNEGSVFSSEYALFSIYKRTCAKYRGHSFELCFEEFFYMTQQNCYYCGISPSNFYRSKNAKKGFYYNGIDRINNELGYTKSNSVCCCKDCNNSKSNLTQEEFINRIKKCYNHLKTQGEIL